MDWVGIDEAATRTGASKEALRKRAQRGAEHTRKGEDGNWQFEIPYEVQDSPVRGQDTRSDDAQAMRFVLNIQREHIRDLQQQVAVKDAQIEGLMSRVPELPAAEDRRSWWRRILGD